MIKGPKLNWMPMKECPGEYEAIVGDIQLSVATEGQWDISAWGPGGHRLHVIDCGNSNTLTAAKRKCQQWLERQWRAMCKLQEQKR